MNPAFSTFYSSFVSSVQRLPNGNTMITEGQDGRIFEITAEHELVWEYLSPYTNRMLKINLLYRAYRIPYEWVPRIDRPTEKVVPRFENNKFRVPGSSRKRPLKVTRIRRGK